jgi:hypothetical protein
MTKLATLLLVAVALRLPAQNVAPWYAAALATGDVVNAAFRIDRDNGGYVDSWTTVDKQEHFFIAWWLTDRAAELHVRPITAASITCLGAVGFEFSQGHVSKKDIVASCSGAFLNSSFRWLRHRLQAE